MHSQIHHSDASKLHHAPTATSTPLARTANATPTRALAPSPIQAQTRAASATMYDDDDDIMIHRMSSTNSTSPLSLVGTASVKGLTSGPPRPTTVRIANARKILKPSPIQENVYRPSFPMMDNNSVDDNSWRQSPIKTTSALGEDDRSTRSYDTHRSRHSFY
jgi:hypothetical protein